MPLYPSSEKKRQTQELKRRIQTLTSYEPESFSSDEEEESNDALNYDNHQKLGITVLSDDSRLDQMLGDNFNLQETDEEILGIIAGLADQASSKVRTANDGLDFVDLFKAFEAFTKSNDLLPEQYSKYFPCLNVIINLCSYTENSWSGRLSSFIKKHSLGEIRRSNNLALREKLLGFDSSTRERFLLLWYESCTISHEKDARLSQIASQIEYNSIVYKMYVKWLQKWKAIKSTEKQVLLARGFLHKKRMLGMLVLRYKTVLENQQIARQYSVRHKFIKWHKRYKQIGKYQNMAININYMNISKNILKAWAQMNHEREVSRFYNCKLSWEFLDLWVRRVNEITSKEDAVLSTIHYNLCSNSLCTWVERLSVVDDITRRANSMAARFALTNTFHAWKRRLLFDSKVLHFQWEKNKKRLKSIFSFWKIRSSQVKTANLFLNFTRTRNQFRVWQMMCRYKRLEAIKSRDTSTHYLKIWRLQERLLLFTKIQNTQRAFGALELWRYQRDLIKYETNRRYVQFINDSNNRLARGYLIRWCYLYREIEEDNQVAETIYSSNIICHGFSAIMRADSNIIQNEQLAEELLVRSVANRFFNVWKRALELAKEEERTVRLKYFTEDKDLRLKHRVFKKWTKYLLDVNVWNNKSFHIFIQRSIMFQIQFWKKWVERKTAINQRNQMVSTQINHFLINYSFGKWNHAKNRLDTLYSKSDGVLSSLNQPLLDTVYRNWRMRMFKLQTKMRDADDFHKRILHLRLRSYWRLWKQRLHSPTDNDINQASMPFSNLKILSSKGPPQPLNCIPLSVNYFNEPHLSSNFVLETPTRSRVRKPLAATLPGRWRKPKLPVTLDFDEEEL